MWLIYRDYTLWIQSNLLSICYVTATFNEMAIKFFLCFKLWCSIIYVFLHIQIFLLQRKPSFIQPFSSRNFVLSRVFPFPNPSYHTTESIGYILVHYILVAFVWVISPVSGISLSERNVVIAILLYIRYLRYFCDWFAQQMISFF